MGVWDESRSNRGAISGGSGRATEPIAEHKSLAEWPGQGWTESIAERRVALLMRSGVGRMLKRRVGGGG